TIDRTLQYKACERLRQGFYEYGATSASLLILDPKTGAIRAMCSLPDFDPNTYNVVEDTRVYNNTTIFTPYEPGSIFKPLTMIAAMNEEKLTPDTYFYDTGSVDAHCTKPIQNALNKVYKDQTMTGVLENSINTGMVHVVNLLGKHAFLAYLEAYGFGLKTGIPLDSEVTGTIETLREKKTDQVDCYTSTASFGQGITVTPLQMLTAFGAIANEGRIMKPYIVEEIRAADGKIIRTVPEVTKQVVSAQSATLLSAMLVRVIGTGQAKIAAVPGYYVAGKTGTAQIAGPGGYTSDTNHSFVGFAPVDNPAFVMIVKYEKPQRRFADSTAAPVFRDIATFILDYYQIAPER
ncbi:MAG: stage V sporulation protein D, partial [Candidatus Magasanikbacteria bacterium CG11_big_fil_rev_8_21_14_0_20_43_7]